MTVYIKDLIELPDRVRRGDFVLRLSEGITNPKETVDNYVPTPQLVKCFDEALGLIRSSLEARSSKAAYLHGSFGSGKSHFMAILLLLLQNESHARSIAELAGVVSRHSAWTEGKKFLLVPYHMIGATAMESAILGGYAEHLRRLHPDASTPGVYRADEIFKDAQKLRQTMGDQAFFDTLNQETGGSGVDSGWGTIGAGWDAVSFDIAVNAPPKSEDRVRLVGDLVEHFFTAARGAADFVDLDEGLSIISKHAKSLGYDAIIMFLDELVLWLASRAADVSFVTTEGQKLVKLVEAQTADRPAPIISFIARQRDLKELVGDNATGAEITSFTDVLKYWEARFTTIKLEDRNLPAIAEKRVLKPKSEAARQQMDEAFKSTERIREEVMNVLLTGQANREMFRKVYPFSPALVETLVAVSFLLQRERTALKVMLQLLVEQKDRLKLGEIIPVGDIFDAIAEGDEAFSDVMKADFENAKKLYQQKLRPLIEFEHGLKLEELEHLPPDDPKAIALRNDDRLAKTLLLSALAPNVESLKGLTANRLAALNHGTIRSPIPGQEGRLVLNKIRKWAAEVGQIKIGDEPSGNATISVQLTGVDTESIIQQAQTEDNQGNRIRKIKELLFSQLDIAQRDELFMHHDFTWRATKRSCEILVTNVRELPYDSFKKQGDEWRVIIDYPFDSPGHTPKDDIARIDNFRNQNEGPSRTIVWLPSFLSPQAQKDLGTLVKLEHVLTGERYSTYVTHLSPVDQNAARALLDNQRSQLRQRLIHYLNGAYNVATPAPGSVDTSHELSPSDHVQSLDEGFAIQPPVGADLKQAFLHLLEQALDYQYSAHPHFESDTNLGPAVLKRVHTEIERAAQEPDGRIPVERERRKELRQIANPLRLGEMAETHFVIGQYWKNHFQKKAAEHGGPVTVAKLRTWIDEPSPMGLPKPLQNLVILVFAAQTNRSFFLHGGPVTATIDNLSEEFELKEQNLPAQDDWKIATERGASVFGVTSSPLLNASNLAKFVGDIKEVVARIKPSCDTLEERLRQILPTMSEKGTSAPRYKTAQSIKTLVDEIARSIDGKVVESISRADIGSSAEAMGHSLKKAGAMVEALNQVNWELLEAVNKLTDERQEAARAIRSSLTDALEKDEHAVALGPALRDVQSRAVRLLAEAPKPSPPPPQPGPGYPPAPPTGRPTGTYSTIAQGSHQALSKEELDALVEEIRGGLDSDAEARLRVTWEVYKP